MRDYDTWLSTNPGEPTAIEEEMFLQWCEKNGVDPQEALNGFLDRLVGAIGGRFESASPHVQILGRIFDYPQQGLLYVAEVARGNVTDFPLAAGRPLGVEA